MALREGAPSPQPHDKERDVTEKSLLQMIEEVASKVRLLEREKSEAVTRIQTLEREVGELSNLITLAGTKVDEILKVGVNEEMSRPQAVNMPLKSKGHERLGEFSPDPHKELKGRSPRVFDPTEFSAQ
jgi:hypothetical protein